MSIDTREQAWAQLNGALHQQLNQARKDWDDDIEDRIAEASTFLTENPAPAEGAPEPVTIVLSRPSLGQIEKLLGDYFDPLKTSVAKLTGAVDLITRMADAQELWLSILDLDTIVSKEGTEVSLSEQEQAYLRSVLADILMFAGRPDYLTEHLGPAPEYVAPAPIAVPQLHPQEQHLLNGVVIPPMPVIPPNPVEVPVTETGVQVTVTEVAPPAQPAAAPVQSRSPLAEVRARRQAMDAQHPPETPGVEVWVDAPEHICRENLDVDDLCMDCGRHVPTGGRVQVIG